MYNYQIHGPQGQLLGMMSLESEDIPNLMMEGIEFDLSCAYAALPATKFKAFLITERPAVEKETVDDRTNGAST